MSPSQRKIRALEEAVSNMQCSPNPQHQLVADDLMATLESDLPDSKKLIAIKNQMDGFYEAHKELNQLLSVL